jgi:hypothetical protein
MSKLPTEDERVMWSSEGGLVSLSYLLPSVDATVERLALSTGTLTDLMMLMHTCIDVILCRSGDSSKSAACGGRE